MAPSITASATTTIDREIQDVFDYLVAVSTMDDWVDGMAGTALVSGSGGTVGDVYESEYTSGGRTTPMELRVTAVDPPTRLAVESREGPFPFAGELSLSEAGSKTHVTNPIEAGSDGRFTAVLFTLLAPVMRWLMRRRLRAELAALRDVLERSADRSSRRRSADRESRRSSPQN